MTDIEQLLHEKLNTPCIRDLFGFKLLEWEPGAVSLTIDHRPVLGHLPGWFQGSVTTAIAEFAAGLSGVTSAPEKWTSTVQQNIHFTGAARGDRLIAKGRMLSSGRSVSMIEANVWVEREGERHHCATMTMTVFHSEPKKS